MQILRPRRQHQQFLHQLSQHGAQTRCMFSVLKATENNGESHKRTKRRPVFDKYAAEVTSFVESYIAANQIYPKISKVVQKTGGNRSTIRRILIELNLEKNAIGSKELCVKGRDDMRIRHTINSPDVEIAQVEASIDSMDAEIDNARIDISPQNLEEKGCLSVQHESTLLTPLDKAMHSSNKSDANRRVTPLMEVLQQKSTGSSRRVHLSACGGIETDLSWEESLRSIMPTPIHGKEYTSDLKDEQQSAWSILPTPIQGKEDISDLKDEQPKVNMETMGHAFPSSEKCNGSSGTVSGFNFTITVVSSKAKSILRNISGKQLHSALKCADEVFKDLKSIKLFRKVGHMNAHAILQFKNNESMKTALKLEIITIAGERLSLQKGLVATVDLTNKDYSTSEGLGKKSVFQEVLQGMAGSQKTKNISSEVPHSPTRMFLEDKKSDVCMQAGPVSHPSFSKTLSIRDCPSNIPLESLHSFFSVFGKVQTSYGASTLAMTPSLQILVEFEKESDKEKALKVQQFTVDGCSFVLRPAFSSLLIQLKCEESTRDLKAVAAACNRYGVVKKISIKKSDTIDVTFGAHERHRSDELLKSIRGDTYFKENWKFLPVYEGYVKAEIFQPCYKEKLTNMVVVLNWLIDQLNGLLAMKGLTSKEVADNVKSTSVAGKVV